MKTQFLTLLGILAMNSIASAGDVQIHSKAMEAGKNSVSINNGEGEAVSSFRKAADQGDA